MWRGEGNVHEEVGVQFRQLCSEDSSGRSMATQSRLWVWLVWAPGHGGSTEEPALARQGATDGCPTFLFAWGAGVLRGARLPSELRPSPLSSHPTLLIWSNGS